MFHGVDSSGQQRMAARDAGSSARRRRERRLRAQWRHEQQTVAMVLAAAQHHSAPKSAGPVSHNVLRNQNTAREGTEFYAMSEDSNVAGGGRLPSLVDVRLQEWLQQRTVEQIVDPVPLVMLLHDVVPQMVEQLVDFLAPLDFRVAEQVIEVLKIVCPPRGARTVLCAPQMADQLVEVPTEAGYALAVVAVQTLGWRAARALLEQVHTATPGRDTNTSSSWRCLRWVSLLHRDRAHSANCAEDRILARCSSWIGTRPSLCNDRAGWSRQFSLEVPQVQFLPGWVAGRCHSFSSSTRCVAVKGFWRILCIFRAPPGCPGVERQSQLGSPR